MSYTSKLTLAIAISLSLAASAVAQHMGMGQAPHIPGLFAPVVGSGATYQVSSEKGGPMNWTYAVVGEEEVEGQKGYWLEMRTTTEQGEMIMKDLMVRSGSTPSVKRMIMQSPGRPPIEMPVAMLNQAMQRSKEPAEASGQRGLGEKVGSETITVPAGTFVCDHYRGTGENANTDLWISTKVAPYGLVKMTSAKTTMVLEKVLEHETSKITGEPQKMPMMPGMH